jgi:hypothetical protein
MCYCPFAKAHCESGVVEKGTNLVCEFWGGTDCRIRLVLELLEKKLKG